MSYIEIVIDDALSVENDTGECDPQHCLIITEARGTFYQVFVTGTDGNLDCRVQCESFGQCRSEALLKKKSTLLVHLISVRSSVVAE
jgi:mRNA-degrading endonuclease toxin of MazEF toxin-antitoxin module